VAPGFELASQRFVVVDLAVEGDAERSIRGPHGLGPAGVVDDGQASVSQPEAPLGIRPVATRVRPPVHERIGHALEVVRVSPAEEARNAAHQSGFSRL
jgi:hypothetical protein